MPTVQIEQERRTHVIDSASDVDSKLLMPGWFEQLPFVTLLKRAEIGYFEEIAQSEVHDLAADDHIWTDPMLSNTSTTVWFKPGGHFHLEDEDVLLEDMLEPIPLEVQTIKLLVTYVGEGKPILQNDVELSLFDEEK